MRHWHFLKSTYDIRTPPPLSRAPSLFRLADGLYLRGVNGIQSDQKQRETLQRTVKRGILDTVKRGVDSVNGVLTVSTPSRCVKLPPPLPSIHIPSLTATRWRHVGAPFGAPLYPLLVCFFYVYITSVHIYVSNGNWQRMRTEY